MSPSANKSQSPFLNVSSFPAEELEVSGDEESPLAWNEANSPFQSIYNLEGQEDMADPEADEFVSFLSELHDHEFDDAVLELVNEAASLYEAHFEGESGGGLGTQSMEAERILEEHFTSLGREVENLLEALAENVESHDVHTLTDTEIDTFIDHYVPSSNLSPSFEGFFGSWKKKLKKLAKRGLRLAKKGLKVAASLGLGPILRKLKRYVKPLFKEVLKRAITKLPSYLRPVARRLAKRYLGRYIKEVEAEVVFEADEDATGSVTEIQQVFDLQIAQLLMTSDKVEQEAMLAEAIIESEQRTDDPLKELEHARTEFIHEIVELEEGKDPTRLLENFLPAILPVLKIGIKLAGRKRVVNYLAKYLAKLIRRFVGRKYARPLSRAVVDLGLKYFRLEATDEEALNASGEAVAYTVEETVRKVAALPDYVLEDEQLLESEVLKAFEAAATAYLPPVLPEKAYEERPELREATGIEGFWLGMPFRGKKVRYRKYTGKLPSLKLKPHTIHKVKTWRGKSLSAHLRNRLGLHTGRCLDAEIHLYEVMPGTSLQEICRLEKKVSGLGTDTKPVWSQLHPLTQEAAGLLLGEPALGRDVPEKYLSDPSIPPAVGQRFYYLEIAGARPQMVPRADGAPTLRQTSAVNLVINFPGSLIRVFIFVSEAKAQKLSVKLRQHTSIGVVMNTLKSTYESGLRAALSGGMSRQVEIIHKMVSPDQSHGQALKWLPQVVHKKLEEKLLEWVGQSLSNHLRERPQGFITATEADADGVTGIITLSNPSGLPKIRRVLGGEPVVLRGKWFSDELPDAKIQIVPGYQRG